MTPTRDYPRPTAEDQEVVERAQQKVNDPGGSHAKGCTAEPGPQVHVLEGPVPLAASPEQPEPIHVPERDNHVQPTGRSEPGDYTPNDRLMGADR